MTGYADRFSDTQRAALAALGYTVLERRPDPDASSAYRGATPGTAGAAVGREQGRGVPHAAGGANRHSRPTAAPTVPPGRIVIAGMDGSALARGILQAATAAAGEGDARVRQAGDELEITLGGEGGDWSLTLDQLRRSPKHKAALWRALRSLARSPA